MSSIKERVAQLRESQQAAADSTLATQESFLCAWRELQRELATVTLSELTDAEEQHLLSAEVSRQISRLQNWSALRRVPSLSGALSRTTSNEPSVRVAGGGVGSGLTALTDALSSFGGSSADAATDSSSPSPAVFVYSWGVSNTDQACLFRGGDAGKSSGAGAAGAIEHIDFKSHRTIMSIATNSYHTAAVTTTGELYVAGSNDEGQCGDVSQQASASPPPPPQLSTSSSNLVTVTRPRLVESLFNVKVSFVACGTTHTVAITSLGLAFTFGSNEAGELGRGEPGPSVVQSTPARVFEQGSRVWISAACGDKFTLLLSKDGAVHSCGVGACIGQPSGEDGHRLAQIEGLIGQQVQMLSASPRHAVVVCRGGGVFGWGCDSHGQLARGDAPSADGHVQTPCQLRCCDSVDALACGLVLGAATGYSHTLCWTDRGVVLACGLNKHGQLGLPSAPISRLLVRVPLPSDDYFCSSAACGLNHSLFLLEYRTEDATASAAATGRARTTTVWGCGQNHRGQVDPLRPENVLFRQLSPIQLLNVEPLAIFCGGDQSFVIAGADGGGTGAAATVGAGGGNGGTSLLLRQFSSVSVLGALHRPDFDLAFSELATTENPHDASRRLAKLVAVFASCSMLNWSFSAAHHGLPHGGGGGGGNSLGLLPLDWLGLEASYAKLVAALEQGEAQGRGGGGQGPTTLSLVDALDTAARDVAKMLEAQPHSPFAVNIATRVVLILWMCPLLRNSGTGIEAASAKVTSALMRIFNQCTSSSEHSRDQLVRLLRSCPIQLLQRSLLAAVQKSLSEAFVRSACHRPAVGASLRDYPQIFAAAQVAGWLYVAADGEIEASSFYNPEASAIDQTFLLTDYLAWVSEKRQAASLDNQQQQQPQPTLTRFCSFAFLFSVEVKRALLLAKAALDQRSAQIGALMGQHARVFADARSGQVIPYLLLSVPRDEIVSSSMNTLAGLAEEQLKLPLKVAFRGEEGVDAGGVTKEYFQLLTAKLFSLQTGLFAPCAGGTAVWLNGDCTWQTDEYRLIGTLLGLAVYNNVVLNVCLPRVLYKKLLQMPLSLRDVADVDEELHRGLEALLAFEPAEEVEHVFCRTFEISWIDLFGETKSIELVPGGVDIPVTGANRAEFVKLYAQWLLVSSIEAQFAPFAEGFSRVIEPPSPQLLSHTELELLVTGSKVLDFEQLRETTRYEGGWTADHQTIVWLWEVLLALSPEEQQQFLQFTTGAACSPLGGLREIKMVVQRAGPDSTQLPTSHTCFATLLLPEYGEKEKLRERLLVAIKECEGFGLQ